MNQKKKGYTALSEKKITIRDIAREAGVSIATVSRVLAGQDNVSPATAEAVRRAVDKHNFTPSALARGFNQQRTNTIGMVMPSIKNPYYAEMYADVRTLAEEKGYTLMLFSRPTAHPVDEELVRSVRERRLEGIIINDELFPPDRAEENERLLTLLRKSMPVVLLGCMQLSLPCPAITIDLTECMRLSMEYLISLGHERIAYIGGNDDRMIPGSRDAGYAQALKDAMLPYIAEYRVFGECTVEEGYRLTSALLDNLIPSQWPTAMVAANDLVALGAMHAFGEKGLRIPEDISLIGCDDQFFAPYLTPPLTSVNTHGRDAGHLALNLLLNNETPSDRIVIPCEMTLRSSCSARNVAALTRKHPDHR